jgi:hypothetical protein
MEKTCHKSYGRYACAEESFLPGGTSPLIISNDDDDDLVSVNELFARADPDPAPTAATATPAACTHKRQIFFARELLAFLVIPVAIAMPAPPQHRRPHCRCPAVGIANRNFLACIACRKVVLRMYTYTKNRNTLIASS